LESLVREVVQVIVAFLTVILPASGPVLNVGALVHLPVGVIETAFVPEETAFAPSFV